MTEDTDSANVRFPPPVIYLLLLVLGIWTGRKLNLPGIGLDESAVTVIGALLAVIGVIVNFAGAGLFHKLRTAIIPFKPATKLVTSGIYGWTRNPMYLGMALIYAGIAILFDSILALALLPLVLAIIQTNVIAREEVYLERRFGDAYRDYKRRVRRWI